mmetsp:Transcript_42670/g.109887  ORF Transcript_42670/g.109887 Transcript_42670/m.109887 type:complete len:330 (+) Transcript_42670:1087-2076(+)
MLACKQLGRVNSNGRGCYNWVCTRRDRFGRISCEVRISKTPPERLYPAMRTERLVSGRLLTSMEMKGFSLTLLSIADQEWLKLLDQPVSFSAWPGTFQVGSSPSMLQPSYQNEVKTGACAPCSGGIDATLLQGVLFSIAGVLRENASKYQELDSLVGDGDLGESMERASIVLLEFSKSMQTPADPGTTLFLLGKRLAKEIGGSSGPLYGVLLVTLAQHLPQGWAQAARASLRAVMKLGNADVGDCSMVDVLEPAVRFMEHHGGSLDDDILTNFKNQVLKAAEETASMIPQVGRSAYVGERAKGVRDPGAVVAADWLACIAEILKRRVST